MAGRFADFLVHGWLKDLGTCYIAAHFDNPDVAGAYASEVWGGAYVRCKTFFSEPTGRATWNSSLITFTGLPSIMITHLAAWDVAVNGNYLACVELPSPIRVLAGGRYDLGTEQVAFSFKG